MTEVTYENWKETKEYEDYMKDMLALFVKREIEEDM